MATYRMTPSERRARALALRQQRENRNLYQQYLTQKAEYDRRVEQQRQNAIYEANRQKELENQNFFVRAGHTIADLAANVITGASKGLEGIYDFGAGIVGAVGGLFDQNFQDNVQKNIAYDWTMETFGNDWQDALKYSYLKDDGLVEKVASGIGQMLPAVAVTIATGGAGAASLATMGVSAAGNATESAYNDGAGYYQGLAYGAASGVIEAATEKMFGGATKALTGAGFLDNITRSVADTGIKRIAKNAIGEGVEEVASELVNPLAKSIYKGKDALKEYGDLDYWKGVGEAGAVGALVSPVYGGTAGYGLSKFKVNGQQANYVGKEADINDSLTEISKLTEQGVDYEAKGKLDAKTEAKIADTKRRNYQNIEKVLQSTSAEKRAKLIEKFGLNKAFDSQGAMSEQLRSTLNVSLADGQANADGSKTATSTLASPKREYYSVGLRGNEQTVQADLQRLTEDSRRSYAESNKISEEAAAEQVADIKVFDGEMSEQAQEHFTKMKQGLRALNKISGADISFVVTDTNNAFNGTLVDDRTMYIAADTFEEDTWAGTLVHEYTHLAEGSEEYNKLVDYLASDDILVDDGNGGKVKLWQKAQDSVFSQNYGFTPEAVQGIFEKINAGETLTAQEKQYYDGFKSEVGARMSEYMLGNEAFIDKVVAKDAPIASKFVTRIQNLLKMFKRIGSESKAEYKQLKKAESLYLAAARKAGNQALVRKILKGRDEDNEDTEADTDAEVDDEVDADVKKVDDEVDTKETSDTEKKQETKESAVNTKEDIRYSRRNKPIPGQMDIFHDILGMQDDAQTEAWDSNYTKQAKDNADNIIKKLKERGYEQVSSESAGYGNGRGHVATSNDGQGSRVYDFEAIRRIFETSGARTAKESKLYSEVVRKLNGYSVKHRSRLSAWKIGVIDDDFYTYDMLRIAEVNKTNGIGTVFYLEGELYRNDRRNDTMAGLFFLGDSNVYVSALISAGGSRIPYELKKLTHYGGKSGYYFDYIGAWSGEKYVATRGENNQSRVTMRHERLHLLYDAASHGSPSFSQATYNAIRALKEFVEQRFAGRADDIHRSIKDYYVKELGYGTVKTAIEEIACDLYCEDLILNDETERAEAQKLIDKIDKTLNDVVGKDGVRYSRKDDVSGRKYSAELSDGQVRKLLADTTKLKVYSKVEAEGIVNHIVSDLLGFGDRYGVLSGKSKAQAIDMLWRGLNTAEPNMRLKVALDIADYIIQNSVVESEYNDIDAETHLWTISLLKPYLHSINLDNLKGEIAHHYGKSNSAYLLWGKSKGKTGFGADQVAMDLEAHGMRIDADNDADIFFEIDSAYRSAVAALKKKAKDTLTAAMSKDEREALRQKIAKEVLLAADQNGKASKLSKIIDKYREKANVWKKAYYEERGRNKIVNRVLDKVQKIKDLKLGTFLNASQFKSDIFKGSIDKLANIKFRGNLNQSGTRNIVAGLSEWYVKDNPMLEGVYDKEVAEMLQGIANGEGELGVNELKALENVADYFKHFVETYNKVYRNGKYVEAKPLAQKYVDVLHENKNVNVGWFAKLSATSYFKTFADPMTIARRMDMYERGFYTEILERLREGAVGASVMEMEMRQPLEEFYKKNKKYLKELSDKTVKYQGKDIPLSQAMLLYMTLNREQALRGLAESGFTYKDEKETVRLQGFAENYKGEDLSLEQLKEMAKGVQEELSKQFSELDKEYISIAEKLFNETCKQAKKETDIKRKGYSNALEDYYVPIRRANIAYNVDTNTFADEMDRVSNASFNKDTVKGAKNELYIEAIDSVLNRHIRAVAQYANLALAIDEYNKLFNLDIGDNPNRPTSVKTESANAWNEGDRYFKKLISDIQGVPVVTGEGTKFMSFIRGGYAKFQLGANPKVWVTQLSSFAAAMSILNPDSITRGLSINTSDVDEYCKLAAVRNTDNTAALAQGVLDKVDKVGQVLMKPIGMVDRFVVKKLFGACQVQVEKDGGPKAGTKENKVKAGELLEKVILETQQNAMATERSAAMRTGNEFVKTLTMFTADSMKVIGRVIDGLGEVSVLKAKRRAATDANVIKELDEKIKRASKQARRAGAALVSSAVFMALVAQLFRTLYNKDDEDENIVANMALDAAGNLLGGLPILKDIYARLLEGYDIDNYAYSAINNLLDSAAGIFNMVGDIFTGKWDSKDIAKNAKNTLFAAGQVFGIPTRNIYNIGHGLIKRFSPSTAYSIDDMFYNQNYRSDLKKAIERGDDAMIATITGIMLDENIGGVTSSAVRKELDKLVKAGYNVIPRSVGNSVTYNGEEHELSNKQVEQFKAVYGTANEALASLVSLSQYYSATDEVKAKAVNFIFDTYYNLALQNLLGVDLESKNILFAEAIDIEKLAIIVAMARSLTADVDRNGKVISGTRKAKVQKYVNSLRLTAAQKYMIMGYLGYTNARGEAQVKAYINRLRLTKDEKAKLLAYSGY